MTARQTQSLDRMSEVSTCPTCRTVQAVCFWGSVKVAAWKRPALLLASLLIIGGMIALAVAMAGCGQTSWQWFLVVPTFAGGGLGLVVAVRGCADCVARNFGNI